MGRTMELSLQDGFFSIYPLRDMRLSQVVSCQLSPSLGMRLTALPVWCSLPVEPTLNGVAARSILAIAKAPGK